MTEELFIHEIDIADELYRIIRDEERCADLKSYMESLWEIYSPYADGDFRQQVAQDFHARFWEMYLTCKLISMSFNIAPKQTGSQGPDILIDELPRRIFLEAITPSRGVSINPDKVEEFKVNTFVAVPVPDIEMILRYAGAISDKYKKYCEYLEQGIISPTDSYVIALNSCKIPNAIIDMTIPDDLPRIVKTVVPIGYKEVTIGSTSSGATVPWRYQYRPNVYRSSGSSVPTDLFLRDEFAGISGVMYSHSDVANRRDGFVFIHNPKSKNAIPKGHFKFGIEFFIELGQESFSISWEDWRSNT